MTSTTTTKTNRYAAQCFECGGRVPANAGTLERYNGRWIVRHQACNKAAAAIDARLEAVATGYRYAGMTWTQVAEANEFWDGEDEIRDAARREWEAKSGMFCRRHGDSIAAGDTGCWECEAEADERRRDLADGIDRDECAGGTCRDILQMCSRHSASYQRHYGRASNE